MEFYEQINKQVSSDADASHDFLKLIIEQLFSALSKELLEQFDDKISSIDSIFTKEDNLKYSNKVFQEAEDIETIIQHMTQPVDLERKCFKKKYMSLQKSYAEETVAKFDDQVTFGMKRCQEFIDQVIKAFQDKGEQNQEVTDE